MFASEFSDHYIPEFSVSYAVFVLVLYLGLRVFASEFPDHYTVFMPEFSVPYTVRVHARVFCPLHTVCVHASSAS